MIYSPKEIFYCAQLLGFEQIIGVEYLFPVSESAREAELNEVKLSLHKRKLLRENSKGHVFLVSELSDIIAALSTPDRVVAISDSAILYECGEILLVSEKNGEDFDFTLFTNRRESDEYIAGILSGKEVHNG